MKALLLAILTGLLVSPTIVADAVPLTLDPLNGPDESFKQSADGVTEIHANLPLLARTAVDLEAAGWVLEMDYFCIGGSDFLRVTPGPPFTPAKALKLPGLAHSETWTPYAAPLIPRGKVARQEFRLDLELTDGAVLQLRNLRLRPAIPDEFDEKPANTRTNAASDADLEAYLDQSYGQEIGNIRVDAETITITGKLSKTTHDYSIGDIAMEAPTGVVPDKDSLVPVPLDVDGNYKLTLPRIATRGRRPFDRLSSRWQILQHKPDGDEAATHAKYTDEVISRSPELPPAKLDSKKGLGGWHPKRLPDESDELKALGIDAVTVNIFSLHKFVALTSEEGTTPFEWQGRTYYAREKEFARHDHTFRTAQDHGAMVSAILLIDNPVVSKSPEATLLGHPDAVKEGKYSMPNLTSTEGISYYGAILDRLAERWSHHDSPHGRVHHWIVHNEVDFGWIWTNAGKKSDIAYMDLYQRSMRLIHLITRQYDPNAQAFITLTHHWADQGNEYGYGSKRMIELLLQFCKAEGDFDWALAHHPYPQSLFNPRTWEDKQATFDFDSPKITPLNLEVLDAYMKLPALRFNGKVRPVHLSENGFNSKDYSIKSFEDQAAGMALAWKKMENLSSIESWQYHNWIDNRREGGLRIGLRKFPDTPGDPYGKKPIWFLYQALGTPQEDAVAAPYLKTIGISSWDEVIHQDAIR